MLQKVRGKNIAHKLLNELSSQNFQIYYGYWRSAVAFEDKHRFENLEHKKSGKPPTLVQTFGFEYHLAIVFAEKSKKLKFKINRNLHVIPRLDHYWKKFLDGDLNNTDVGIDGLQIFDWFKENHYTLIEEEIESSEKYQKEIIKN